MNPSNLIHRTNRSFVSYPGNDHGACLNALRVRFPSAVFNGPVQDDGRQLITVVGVDPAVVTNADIRRVIPRRCRGHMMPSVV